MTTSEHTTDQRTCRAQPCPVEVAADQFMCPSHWKMVPPPLRAAIEASYPSNSGPAAEPSAEFLALAQGAIDAVAHKEARTAPRKAATPEATPTATVPKTTARRRRKAVQLALFELSDTP